jgi:hypothetical protein
VHRSGKNDIARAATSQLVQQKFGDLGRGITPILLPYNLGYKHPKKATFFKSVSGVLRLLTQNHLTLKDRDLSDSEVGEDLILPFTAVFRCWKFHG